MTDNPISDSALHMRLTAYLDGELGDDDHHDVEQKLLSDPQSVSYTHLTLPTKA